MPHLRLLPVLLIALLSACASAPAPEARRQQAMELARTQHWQGLTLDTRSFPLQAFVPPAFAAERQLVIYLEGDGFAWRTASQPSDDPTPINPLALRLALAQPGGNAAYLARPCQYLGAQRSPCSQRYWTDARFADNVVASVDQAISTLKARAKAQELVLVGYSGGAAIALLLAARRDDISRVVTVAGNLDHRAWTEYHRVQPLRGSLNPADDGARLAHLEQIHLVGADDRVLPPSLAQRFVREHPTNPPARVWVMPGYTHQSGWAEHWPSLWQRLEQTP
ncbi:MULTISPECIES: alpha/beta fold hydrolase [Pseudomonas]|uniref:alpha/beta fold hydrolase n=1 Tax=Pseudomonas TaxID=286 RepID=UPI00069FC896|nr:MULTISPECIES: hypothetical protein [Pseudomonas]MBH8610621.1 alpha/beta hydrolase [Pseudomonas mohnii]RTY75767.1 alpha/beta hydrolase [Pseudomonas veronii]